MPKVNADFSGSAGGDFFTYDDHKASSLLNFVPDLAVVTRVRIDVTKLLGPYSTGPALNNYEPVFGWGSGTALGSSLSFVQTFDEDRRLAQRFLPQTSAGRVAIQVNLSRDATSDTTGLVVGRLVEEVLLGAQQEGATYPAHDTKNNHQYSFLPYDIGGNQVGFPIVQLPVGSTPGGTGLFNFEFELEGHILPSKAYWFVLSTTSGGKAYAAYETPLSNVNDYALKRDPLLGWISIAGTTFRDRLAGRFRLQRSLSSAGATGYGENLTLGLTAWDPATGRAYPFISTAGNSQKVAIVDIPTAIVARKDSRGHISISIVCSAGAETPGGVTVPPRFSRFDYSMKIDFKSGG